MPVVRGFGNYADWPPDCSPPARETLAGEVAVVVKPVNHRRGAGGAMVAGGVAVVVKPVNHRRGAGGETLGGGGAGGVDPLSDTRGAAGGTVRRGEGGPGEGRGKWAGFWMGYYGERSQGRASGDPAFGRGRWLEVLQHGLAGAMLDGAIWIRFLL